MKQFTCWRLYHNHIGQCEIGNHFSTNKHLLVASSIELSIPRMTLDVFGKAAIFCNSERKIMENWAFSWNRIMGSALDKIKKKKILERLSGKGEEWNTMQRLTLISNLKHFHFSWKGQLCFPVDFRQVKLLRMVKRLSGNQVIYWRLKSLGMWLSKFKLRNQSSYLGPVVWWLISTDPRLSFSPGFFISLGKGLFGIIFSILFKASSCQIIDRKNSTEFPLNALRS